MAKAYGITIALAIISYKIVWSIPQLKRLFYGRYAFGHPFRHFIVL